MEREVAARLLGVSAKASEAEIQAAFRDRARSVHPDAASSRRIESGSGADLDQLSQARDTLLGSRPAVASPTRTASGSGAASRPPRTGSTRAGRFAWRSAIVAIGALAVLAIAIIVVAAAVNRPSSRPSVTGCLVVSNGEVEAASCDDAGAQRVVAEYQGVRDCTAGNTLVSGDTTWCLQPVDG